MWDGETGANTRSSSWPFLLHFLLFLLRWLVGRTEFPRFFFIEERRSRLQPAVRRGRWSPGAAAEVAGPARPPSVDWKPRCPSVRPLVCLALSLRRCRNLLLFLRQAPCSSASPLRRVRNARRIHTHTHTHTQAKTKATERWNRWIRLKKMPPHSELANAALVVGGLPVAASASASRFRKAAHKRRYKRSRSNSKSSQPSDEELSSSGKQQNIWVKNTFEELLGNTSDPANLKDSEKREFNWITSWIIWYLISGSNNLEGYRVVQVEPVDLFLLISLLVYANICNRYVRSNDKEMMLWIWYVPSLQLLGLFAVALVGSLWIRGSTIAYWLCSGAGWPSSSSERGKLGERVRSEIESSNKSQQGTDLQRQKKKKTTDPPWWSVESEKFFCWQVIQPKR